MRSFKKITKSWWFPWLVLGVALRLILSVITAHSDLWALFFAQHLFVFKGVFNVYDYLSTLPKTADLVAHYGTNFFTYPPLAYFLFGVFGLILRPFLSLANFSWLAAHYPQIYQNPVIYQTLLWLKLPYLFFDLGIAFLLVDFFSDPKKKKLAFLLWIFNPLSLYTSFMVGQFGVIPLFFSVLALRFASKKRNRWAAFSLGVGGALKMFPFLFLPFLVILLGKTWWQRIKLAFLGVLPYVVSVLPFLTSRAFRQVSLFSSQSQKMLHMVLPLSGAEGIYVFVFLFAALLVFAAYRRQGEKRLWWYFLVIMLLFFSITHYHPQWFLWLTPFLVLEMVKDNFSYRFLGVVLLSCWAFIALTFEPSLNFGLFSPLNPNLISRPGFFEQIRFFDVFQLKSIVRSIAAAASFGLFFLTFKKNAKAF